MGRAKQAIPAAFFLRARPKITAITSSNSAATALPAGIRQHTVCTGGYLQSSASLWLAPRFSLHSFSSVQAAFHQLLPRHPFFFILDPKKKQPSTTADGVGSLVWLLSEVKKSEDDEIFKTKFLPVGSQIHLSSKQDATSYDKRLLH
jgi:hypothetical protein